MRFAGWYWYPLPWSSMMRDWRGERGESRRLLCGWWRLPDLWLKVNLAAIGFYGGPEGGDITWPRVFSVRSWALWSKIR